MKRHVLSAVLALCLAMIALAFILPRPTEESSPATQEPQTMPQLNLSYRARTNDSTDVIRITLESTNPHVTARVLIEDPSSTPAKTLRTINITALEGRDLQLRSLPALFRVRGVIEQPGTSVLTKWVWRGEAHVIIADTPGHLAEALKGATP